MTILIADDSTLIRSNLARLIAFKRKDLQIREAFDVASTIHELKSSKIDVLILDLNFPDGSGFDVLEYLRAGSEKPFIMVLTNIQNRTVREKSLRDGADLFFDKTEEFELVVEEIVRLHKSYA